MTVIRIEVLRGFGKGKQGDLIDEFHSEIRGERVLHLLNRRVRLDGETSNRVYAAENVKILSKS